MDENEIDAHAGAMLCFYRKKNNLSLSRAALVTGLSAFRINEIEHGTGYSANRKECEAFAEAYEIEYEQIEKWLMGEK